LRTWRHENQVKGQVCVKFAASQFHSRTIETCLFDAITLLFPLRNNMSTTTKLLKNSRWFEISNRKPPAACPEARDQATFGSTFKPGAPRIPQSPPEGGKWWR